MKPWLTIIGMGEDGVEGLNASARHALSKAEVLVGSSRLLALAPASQHKHMEWPQPFSKVVEQLKPLRGTATALLATGDPMNFGVTRKLLEFIPADEIKVFPHLSAFSLAAARLKWSLPDCDCFTIHGRPAANLEVWIQSNAKLIALTEGQTSIDEICRRLIARGFETAEITVLENMGGRHEAITRFTANAKPSQPFSPLSTVAIHCIPGANPILRSRVPGLPDDAFEHDGKITKREVRAATLAALAPAPDQQLWDIGAGAGSIAIEWMRSTRGCEAFAIEPDATRAATIARNADALGTPRLKIIESAAPGALASLPQPDAIFIGGGIDSDGVFEAAWHALKPHGSLVANSVTLEGDAKLIALHKQHGGDLVRMDVSTLTNIGDMRAMRPRMSVLQWRITK